MCLLEKINQQQLKSNNKSKAIKQAKNKNENKNKENAWSPTASKEDRNARSVSSIVNDLFSIEETEISEKDSQKIKKGGFYT